eukprot:5769277-Lingulodinium_polyedra.AAC.1
MGRTPPGRILASCTPQRSTRCSASTRCRSSMRPVSRRPAAPPERASAGGKESTLAVAATNETSTA